MSIDEMIPVINALVQSCYSALSIVSLLLFVVIVWLVISAICKISSTISLERMKNAILDIADYLEEIKDKNSKEN